MIDSFFFWQPLAISDITDYVNNVSILQAAYGFCLFLFCLDAKKKQKKSRQNPIAPRVFALPAPPRVQQRYSLLYIFLRDAVSLLVYVFTTAACAVSSIPKLPF